MGERPAETTAETTAKIIAPPLIGRRAAITQKTSEPSGFTMKVSDKTLAFDKHLWVQFDGVDVKETGGEVKLTARDEEAYLKVFNHFGRVLKLFIFENGQWVDSDTGLAAKPFDELQAGRLPEAPPGATRIKAGGKKAAKSKAPKKKAAKKPAAIKAAAPKKAKATATKATATKATATKATTTKATATKATARKTKAPVAAGKKAGGKAKTAK